MRRRAVLTLATRELVRGAVAALFACACGKVDSDIDRVRLFDAGPRADALSVVPQPDAPPVVPPAEAGRESGIPPLEMECQSFDECPGRSATVAVPVETPLGAITFDHAWLSYTVGFVENTIVTLTTGERVTSKPSLRISITGNPRVDTVVTGDRPASLGLETCDSQYLQTDGTVHIDAQELTLLDGTPLGYSARIEGSLLVSSSGWRADGRFSIPILCTMESTH